MEVDEIQRQASKFQRVSSNGSTTTTDNSSNPQKIATHNDVVVGGGRLCGWPSSRIVRVSRASGGKDRHSKVLTSKGLRDRRVRLSVSTAIQFYDLQDRLGYDQPSKAVEWLLKAASTSIDDLPSLDPSFQHKSADVDFEDPNYQHQNSFSKSESKSKSKSPACSSTSETSKGSGLSLSRSENRIKARERARGMKETRAAVLNEESSSFTDLLTGGPHSTVVRRPNHWTTPVDYNNIFGRPPQPSTQVMQMPQFNMGGEPHHFSFLEDSLVPAGGEAYNLNFSMATSTSGGPGFSRGTLQSNLPSSLLPHHHRFQSSSIDGSTSTNLPFFISDHFPPTAAYDSQRLHLSYADPHKEKPKN